MNTVLFSQFLVPCLRRDTTYLSNHHLYSQDEVHNSIHVHRHHHVVLRREAHLAEIALDVENSKTETPSNLDTFILSLHENAVW